MVLNTDVHTFEALGGGSMSMQQVIDTLNDMEFDHESMGYEVRITDNITAVHIQQLLRFPYEIAIVEIDGQLVFTTGKSGVANWSDSFDAKEGGRVLFHTHPCSDERPNLAVPSGRDVLMTVPSEMPQILAHADGLLLWQLPIRHAVSQEPIQSQKEIGDAWIEYGDDIGVDTFLPGTSSRYIGDLPWSERIELYEDYADKAGCIVMQAKWDETEKLEAILAILNCTITPATVEYIQNQARTEWSGILSV